jgi:CRP-like cAMP-binding protein
MGVVSQQYTAAMYWAMATISTVGYGDVTANLDSMQEVLYSTMIMIVGMLFYAVVISSLTEIVSQLDVTSSLYKKKSDNVNTYAQIVCLPETLKAKIESYYKHLWTCHLGINGEKLMDYVPPCLKAELISEMTGPIIMNAFFIKDCAGDVVNAVMRKLDLHTYLPGDCLFRHGEPCDMLYLVYNGSVDLLTAGHVKFKTISNGCILGESSFFMFEPHLYTAKTADVTEIFQLSMDSFLGILQEYRLVTKFKDYLSVHQSILLEAKASVEKTLQNWNSSKMVRFLDATNVQKLSKGVILPDSRFRVVWDCVSLAALLYLMISIPMQISFASVTQSIDRAIFGMDLIVDIFFVIDIGCRLRKFAVVEDGYLITTPKNFGLIYRRDELHLDLISACPLSMVAYFTGAPGRVYGIVRLIQAVRVVRVGKYLHNIVEIIDTRTRFVVTTGMLRVFQIFMTIFGLCHVFSCILNFIGGIQDGSREVTWLVADGMQNDSIGMRYLRSFFWSLYTITTIGYGSVPMLTIPERVFAMIVMAIGCVVCDAGLTAILSSIVANKDKQAGMNNRRIRCSKLFMQTNNVDESLQTRILEYHAFANVEMANINEGRILQDLSSPLACEILSYFCFRPLRECPHFDGYSDGALSSLITKVIPYVAIPGEELSTIGNACRSIYVFQRGSIRTADATGMTSNVVEGSVIGHLATVAISKCDGPPTHELCLELMSIRLARSKYGNLYVILGAGRSCCRSSTKSNKYWMERVNMKVIKGNGKSLKVEITVKESRKRLSHATVGSGNLVLSESSSTDITSCVLLDEKGRNVGSIQLRASLRLLSEIEQASTDELTATSLTFSHLYKLDVLDEQSLAKYISNSSCLNVVDRVPISEDIEEIKESGASDSLWEEPVMLKSDTRNESFFVEWTG